MTSAPRFPLVAVDVGNSRVKFGLFDDSATIATATSTATLPAPRTTFVLDPRTQPFSDLKSWLDDAAPGDFTWWIASVQRQVAAQLVDYLRAAEVLRIKLVTSGDLPLRIDVPRPDMVGIDRLLGAVAADRLREPHRPAVVVHLGTAITINLVTPSSASEPGALQRGSFRGGAILPGIGMSAQAMHKFTDLLPLIDMQSLAEPPPAVGESTVPAMTSGLYWGAVGAVKQLIELFGCEAGGSPQVFLTGGAAPSVAKLLPGDAQLIPDLVLSAIAIAAAS
jgi:type III pantothenate kinase